MKKNSTTSTVRMWRITMKTGRKDQAGLQFKFNQCHTLAIHLNQFTNYETFFRIIQSHITRVAATISAVIFRSTGC